MGQHVVVDLGFGTLLNYLRAQRGWSLRGRGNRVHCSHGHVWDLENGQKRPSLAVAALMDEAHGADGRLAAMVRVITDPALMSHDGVWLPRGASRAAVRWSDRARSELVDNLAKGVDELSA
jgi:transcriptional regulator with XRE-family HTH domain